MTDRSTARQLAAEALSRGKPLEWFENLYSLATRDPGLIPWADLRGNPNLCGWLDAKQIDGSGRRALVVGCGLGDDVEALSQVGFHAVGFDISATCIGWCQERFPQSRGEYATHDLFRLPAAWRMAYDFVFEAYTLQVLPAELRQAAIEQIAGCVAPGGSLLLVTRGRELQEDSGKMPWPLLRDELKYLEACGLQEIHFEDYVETEKPPVRRFRVEYARPSQIAD